MYDAEAVATAKEHVARIRARTVCAMCGGQPIEWHNDDHIRRPNNRVSNLVGRGFPLERIDEEIRRCEPLCRSCHMKVDGRAIARNGLLASLNLERTLPPQPCAECERLFKPLRRGLCAACYERRRRRGLLPSKEE